MKEKEVIDSVWRVFSQHLDSSQFKLVLVGSRASGTHHEFSDFDFVIIGKGPVSSSILTKIRTEIDEIKTFYSIDIVDFHRGTPEFRQVASKNMKEVGEGGKLRPFSGAVPL